MNISEKCRTGAVEALKLAEQGKLGRQVNEEFAKHAGTKLRYRNRADLIGLLKFYAKKEGQQ